MLDWMEELPYKEIFVELNEFMRKLIAVVCGGWRMSMVVIMMMMRCWFMVV